VVRTLRLLLVLLLLLLLLEGVVLLPQCVHGPQQALVLPHQHLALLQPGGGLPAQLLGSLLGGSQVGLRLRRFQLCTRQLLQQCSPIS
jgi:hypothetical protein